MRVAFLIIAIMLCVAATKGCCELCEGAQPAARKVVALVFYFDGCVHCEVLHKDIDKTLKPIGWKVGAGGDIDYVDVYSTDARKDKYGKIRSCPTIILIDGNEKEIGRSGSMSATKLSEWINRERQK